MFGKLNKNKKSKRTIKRTEEQAVERPQDLLEETPREEHKPGLKTASMLECLSFDVANIQTDNYFRWLSENAKENGAVPIVNCFEQPNAIEEAMKKATMLCNGGDFKKQIGEEMDKLDQLIPHTMEVAIF